MKGFSACVVAVAACAAMLSAQSKPASAGEDSAIRAIADRYAKASLAADAKAIAELYTDDALEMPPNHATVKGRPAILNYYQEQFNGVKVNSFTLQHVETHALGDTGFDVGTYRQSFTPPNAQTITDTGKYTVIVKRVGGVWKVAYAIYNSDQPPPAAR